MNTRQQKNLENRIEKLKDQNLTLRENLKVLRKDKKSLEKALRDHSKLLKDIPGSVLLVEDGKIILLNKTAIDLLGYAEEEMLGQDFMHFIHPDSLEYVKNIQKRRISKRAFPDDFETHLVTKSGEALCCDFRVKKIRHKGRTAFLFDIMRLDERKQKEMRLLRSKKMEALTRMATGLSKRFTRFVSMLDNHALGIEGIESLADKELIRSLRKVESAREMGTFITDQLACLTRTENKRSNMSLLDLKKMVRDVVDITRPKWKEDSKGRGVNIIVKTYLRNLSPVEGCPRDIQDAFTSIMLNAIEALPEGGEIYLTTEENAGLAHLYVQDNGLGISDAIKDKIFDPFFTTKEGARMGLGLSLAQAIVNRHKGEIEFISKEGQGTTFIIKFPLAPEKPPSKAKGPRKRIRGSNTLIMAEEGIAKDLITQLLVSKGGKVTTISTSMECLKLFKKNPFDLVIIDLDTPNLNASAMIPRIKKMAPGLAVALIHAGSRKGSPRTFRKMGADLVIGRPLDMDRAFFLLSRILSMNTRYDS